uniref:RNA helicase n=1 Tax=Trichuris muris TaxID=70415 RepID=A0A5S6R3J9_TRIMR
MSKPEAKFVAPPTVHLLSKLPLDQERIPKEDDSVEMNPGFIYSTTFAAFSLEQQRVRLPIYKYRNAILYLLEKYQTLVLFGETGCGKSTQVPQYLLEAGWAREGKICVSEPRRVAAVTLASRVAEERGTMFGHEVGYVVRFDDFTKRESTKIKYMTDGILVREIMRNPLLTEYSVVVVDEAHERNVNTDILLGLLRKILAKRRDLRLIVSSATLDAEEFRDFFNCNTTDDSALDTATIMSVEGRSFAIDIYYTRGPVANYVNASVKAAIQIHRCEPAGGDILIFLTGEDEVNTCCNLLKEESKTLHDCDRLWIVPIYGAMPFKEQIKVFDSSPSGTRKVVVATNIAEASVTVPGIVYVIDCGFVKLRAVHPQTGIESLVVVPISKASAEQRAGRAGRIRYGKAYRLYPEAEFEKLRPFTVPEIQRTNLAPALLQLKSLGISNVLKFHYISRPPAYSMIRGLELLRALGAIDDNGDLTEPLGHQIAEFPLPPMHAKALIMSGKLECSEEMLSIISMMQIQNVFLSPVGQKHRAEVMKRRFSTEDGDHLTMLNVFTCFIEHGRDGRWCQDHHVNYRGLCRAVEIRQQLLRFLRRFKVPLLSCRGRLDSEDRIKQCLVYGFFSNAAKLHHDGTYRTIRENFPLKIYKGSAIMYRKEYPKWVIFTEVLQDCMRDVSVIDSEWLYELVPEYYEYGTAGERALKRNREDSDEEER